MINNWYVYIIQCYDGKFYTGITTDLNRRIREHNSGKSRSARFVRTRRPVVLIYSEEYKTRKCALAREREIKKLTRREKKNLTQIDKKDSNTH